MKRLVILGAMCAAALLFVGCPGDDDDTSDEANGPAVGTVVGSDLTGQDWTLRYSRPAPEPYVGLATYQVALRFHANSILEFQFGTPQATSNHQWVVVNGTGIVMAINGATLGSGVTYRGALQSDWLMSGLAYSSSGESWAWTADRSLQVAVGE